MSINQTDFETERVSEIYKNFVRVLNRTTIYQRLYGVNYRGNLALYEYWYDQSNLTDMQQ